LKRNFEEIPDLVSEYKYLIRLDHKKTKYSKILTLWKIWPAANKMIYIPSDTEFLRKSRSDVRISIFAQTKPLQAEDNNYSIVSQSGAKSEVYQYTNKGSIPISELYLREVSVYSNSQFHHIFFLSQSYMYIVVGM
jgi:hypothetical protein